VNGWSTAREISDPSKAIRRPAMRYTEARMTHLGAALMTDMEKDTVDFVA